MWATVVTHYHFCGHDSKAKANCIRISAIQLICAPKNSEGKWISNISLVDVVL